MRYNNYSGITNMRGKFLFCFLCFNLTLYTCLAQDRNIAVNEVYPDAMFIQNGGHYIDVKNLVAAGVYTKDAKGDGVSDDADAIIAAMDWVINKLRAAGQPCGWKESWNIYFPNGTYKVSKTLVYSGAAVPSCSVQNISPQREGTAGLKLIGQSRENVTIKLTDNAEGFKAGANKPVISFSKSGFNNAPAGFHFRNITINTGAGNPGAIGLDFYGANNSRLDNVKIIGKGEIGLHLRIATAHGYYSNFTIDGFKYGIHMNGNGSSTPTIEYVTLTNQTTAAIQVNSIAATLRKLQSTNTVTAITMATVNNIKPYVVIIDSYLKGSAANTAIQISDGFFFGRNINVAGYGTTLKKAEETVIKNGSVVEYCSDAITSFPGRVRNTGIKSLNLPAKENPIISWISDFIEWANVSSFGAKGDDETDDTKAIQDAFNSGKKVIFFPKNKYKIEGTVTIPAWVQQVIAGDAYITGAGEKFNINAASKNTLLLSGVVLARGSITHSAQRDVILEGTRSSNNVYTSKLTAPGSKVFAICSNGFARSEGSIQNVAAYARFINNEKRANNQFNAGANSILWVLGCKAETLYTVVNAMDGAKVEILGGILNRTNQGPALATTGIVNNNSSVSIIFATNGFGKKWDKMVEDVQGNTIKSWLMSDTTAFPSRGYGDNIVMPLYVSYDPQSVSK